MIALLALLCSIQLARYYEDSKALSDKLIATVLALISLTFVVLAAFAL